MATSEGRPLKVRRGRIHAPDQAARPRPAAAPAAPATAPPLASPAALPTIQRQPGAARLQADLLLHRQRQIGNRAVAHLLGAPAAGEAGVTIQRTLGDGHDLTSPSLKGDPGLEAAYDDERLIRAGASDPSVEKLQQALIAAGHPLPKFGADSIFGAETKAAVKDFQQTHGLAPDGLVGPKTMTALDQLGVKPEPPKPEPPKPEPPKTEPTPAEMLKKLQGLDRAGLDQVRKEKAQLDTMQTAMTEAQFGQAAALLILVVPDAVVNKDGARKEALRLLGGQLGGDKTIARGAIDKAIEVVVVPQNGLMTDLEQFKALKGKKTFDGREWDTTRGSGGMQVGGKVYTAIAEENLLGVDCTATIDRKDGKGPQSIGTGAYAKGYSTTTHEFAHTLHLFVLKADDKKVVTEAYTARKEAAKKKPTDPDQWVDGREGCYASMTEEEFFAQLSNAYLGTNTGKDPFVNDDRHNGKEWVKGHEPKIFALLERMYAGADLAGANPRK